MAIGGRGGGGKQGGQPTMPTPASSDELRQFTNIEALNICKLAFV